MWRSFFGGILASAALLFAVWPWHLSAENTRAVSPAPQPVLASFESKPNLPDPNAIFAEVNTLRTARGLPALARSSTLATVASQRAEDMRANNYYAHESPNGTHFYHLYDQHDYKAGFTCENLDMEFSMSTGTFIQAWMSSTKGHRECLLDPRISEAGYAATEIMTSTKSNQDIPTYVVVAIYAETPKQN